MARDPRESDNNPSADSQKASAVAADRLPSPADENAVIADRLPASVDETRVIVAEVATIIGAGAVKALVDKHILGRQPLPRVKKPSLITRARPKIVKLATGSAAGAAIFGVGLLAKRLFDRSENRRKRLRHNGTQSAD